MIQALHPRVAVVQRIAVGPTARIRERAITRRRVRPRHKGRRYVRTRNVVTQHTTRHRRHRVLGDRTRIIDRLRHVIGNLDHDAGRQRVHRAVRDRQGKIITLDARHIRGRRGQLIFIVRHARDHVIGRHRQRAVAAAKARARQVRQQHRRPVDRHRDQVIQSVRIRQRELPIGKLAI